MFSLHTVAHRHDIYKNSSQQDRFVKLLFIEYKSPRRYPLYEKVMSGYTSTNSEIHHQFRIYNKGAKPLNSGYLLVAPRFNRQQVARNTHFGYCHSCLNVLYFIKIRFKQGHPTAIFGKYLFGRRFEIQNFRNICCKFLTCLPFLGFSNI